MIKNCIYLLKFNMINYRFSTFPLDISLHLSLFLSVSPDLRMLCRWFWKHLPNKDIFLLARTLGTENIETGKYNKNIGLQTLETHAFWKVKLFIMTSVFVELEIVPEVTFPACFVQRRFLINQWPCSSTFAHPAQDYNAYSHLTMKHILALPFVLYIIPWKLYSKQG